jgi:hypothetical protein
MRLRLDHCVPRQVASLLVGHECSTARALGWDNLENGDLLAAAAAAGFAALVTVDRNLQHQHDRAALPLGVLVLVAPRNTVEELAGCFPAALEAPGRMEPRTIVEVRAGKPEP